MKCSILSLRKPKVGIFVKLQKHKAAILKAFVKTAFGTLFVTQFSWYNCPSCVVCIIYFPCLRASCMHRPCASALQIPPYAIFVNKYLTTHCILKGENAPTVDPGQSSQAKSTIHTHTLVGSCWGSWWRQEPPSQVCSDSGSSNSILCCGASGMSRTIIQFLSHS